MNKALWITAGLVATAFTAGTVHFNNSSNASVPAGITKAEMMSGKKAMANPVTDAGKPVVVEFFTSQGCSSCPPADRLAGRLAQEPNLLVIERPVTYWDRLGWTDTLGKEENTTLQRAYARRTLGGRNGVYTPQAVVNGEKGLVGSREADLRELIAQARFSDLPEVEFAHKEDGSTEIMITGARSASANVQLVGLDQTERVRIGRGENGGRSVTYTNVYKGERSLGTLAGEGASYMIDAADKRIDGANAYAVIVREGSAGRILTGRMLPSA
ncbi:DUF1223 domain-containing protein [Parerythrobacter jejuensis]|uniref:DUF1223 domain-containing protein n=1 Tax=Parerythrobacter jejuensis TaxID=795812 RepID=A0A845AW79_9SPHN|nr:DUF1223 domain-containing protein [Parerythrobacter jejuensis]MXP31074.1 DUF1223 domain-containing protein [Parerythrobacter jejuensis]MXP33834.1 DUF1223 domain-containing protein [Parerythrobacter jejuensis]